MFHMMLILNRYLGVSLVQKTLGKITWTFSPQNGFCITSGDEICNMLDATETL